MLMLFTQILVIAGIEPASLSADVYLSATMPTIPSKFLVRKVEVGFAHQWDYAD